MNSLDGKTAAAVVFYTASDPSSSWSPTEALASRGYHCVCATSLPTPLAAASGESGASEDGTLRSLRRAAETFFIEKKQKYSEYNASTGVAQSLLQKKLGHRGGSIHVADVHSEEELNALLQTIGFPSADAKTQGTTTQSNDTSTPWLVLVVDVTHSGQSLDALHSSGSAACQEQLSQWKAQLDIHNVAWMRTTQSYASEFTELQQHRTCSIEVSENNNPVVFSPCVMLSTNGLVRDRGWQAGSWTNNVVTMGALLRELGYKTAQLPKYGA